MSGRLFGLNIINIGFDYDLNFNTAYEKIEKAVGCAFVKIKHTNATLRCAFQLMNSYKLLLFLRHYAIYHYTLCNRLCELESIA